MVADAILFSRYFSPLESTKEITARRRRKYANTSSDKILGFKRKLNLWKDYVGKGNLDMFDLLARLKNEDGYQQISSFIVSHLEELSKKINYYFPSLSTELYDWVRNPFSRTSSSELNVKRR